MAWVDDQNSAQRLRAVFDKLFPSQELEAVAKELMEQTYLRLSDSHASIHAHYVNIKANIEAADEAYRRVNKVDRPVSILHVRHSSAIEDH